MASVEVTTTEVPTVVMLEKKVYNLTLSEEEANVLSYLVRSVSGCPNNSNRKYTDSIDTALNNAGVTANEIPGARGFISFPDYF
jgi:hypothetical protein